MSLQSEFMDFEMYRYALAKGHVNGASQLEGYGEVDVPGAVSGRDIWGGPTNTQPDPNWSGFQPNVVGSSAEDSATGTGIRVMRIYYITVSGLTGYEDIPTNGLTPVNATITNVAFIQCALGISAGSTGKAVGNVDVRDGTTVFKRIIPGQIRCLSSKRLVPAGKVLFLDSWGASGATGAGRSTIRLEITYIGGTKIDVYAEHDAITVKDSSEYRRRPLKTAIPEFSLIKCTVDATTNDFISATWTGWLEKA